MALSRRLSKLKTLELRENRLTTLPASIARLGELEHLDIGNNEFSELVCFCFSTSLLYFCTAVFYARASFRFVSRCVALRCVRGALEGSRREGRARGSNERRSGRPPGPSPQGSWRPRLSLISLHFGVLPPPNS